MCQNLKKCSKPRESAPKAEKMYQKMRQYEKVCQNLKKSSKTGESEAKAEKVWVSLFYVEKVS